MNSIKIPELRKPVVDYRNFRLSRINEPQYSHIKLLGGWLVYFALYFITENLIPEEACHVIHCRLDDMIPFNEYFLIFDIIAAVPAGLLAEFIVFRKIHKARYRLFRRKLRKMMFW